jgi:hypothetical protein
MVRHSSSNIISFFSPACNTFIAIDTRLTNFHTLVIHVNLSVEQAVSDIPLLLSSKTPPNSSSNIGSQNYGARPAVVAIGGGFNDEMFTEMKEACGEESVMWARTDITRGADMPDISDKEAYGTATGERVKKCLDELRVGKEGGKTEGVYYF